MTLTGTFLDVVGLGYDNGASKGVTSDKSEFIYEQGKQVTFSIGGLLLGSCEGKAVVTISDLVAIDTPVFHPSLINRARLLFSLALGEGFEQPAIIDTNVEAIVAKYAAEINLDSEELSDLDGPLGKICSELKLRPKSVPHARNHLRREDQGFRVLRDFKIASPDGGYVLADVYLPNQPGKKFPVLISCTLYGRRVPWGGPDLENEAEIIQFEAAEDDWHSTPGGTQLPQLPYMGPWSDSFTTQRGYESIATLNTFTFVPQGYAMVKIDPKGVSQTPGTRWIPGELPGDFFTAVEWSAGQPWSTGSVALVGSSYGANTQWGVAGLKPKGLKCFVPYATDIDSYREAAYIGGVPSTRYLENWFARVRGVSPKWGDHFDVEALMRDNSAYNALWDMLGGNPVESADIPCFLAASQIFMIHGRGAYEAWAVRSRNNTHLQLVDSNYYAWPSRESTGKILQFLNHHLKGEAFLAPEKVGIQVRLGKQDWYWRKEKNWPVPGTQYVKWHLTPELGLSTTPPSEQTSETRLTYPAQAPITGKSGLSFESAPFAEDVDMAGHFAAYLSMSSTAADADVVVLVWALDESGAAVSYGASSPDPEPIAKGFLRVSHRALDMTKSLPWRPWHSHKSEDVVALQGPEDVVNVAVEIMPAACRVRKGWKLRVDILPSETQPDIPGYDPTPMRLWRGETSDGDAVDAIHVGGSKVNYVLFPVVPLQQNYPNCMV
ncbi:galactose-binding domain-like protein [Microdochium bolleyi]|uniref:Galactose-binding domain-like protein n=1 Tax=Microdochium bolleyi TaxID=196109 RepID=A0A136IIU0_9PEZI|nr:galactose-binding domain-like protein [Microdochium bolleyi]